MSYTAEDAHRDSALGAQWMDEHAHGDWRAVIDTTRLDMADCCSCVWGQTHALIVDPKGVPLRVSGFVRVLRSLEMNEAASHVWLIAHGFIADWTSFEREFMARYEMLTCAWIEQIEQRRSDRAAAVEATEAAVLTGDALTLSA